jgi:hypothetical protein
MVLQVEQPKVAPLSMARAMRASMGALPLLPVDLMVMPTKYELVKRSELEGSGFSAAD